MNFKKFLEFYDFKLEILILVKYLNDQKKFFFIDKNKILLK